MPTNGGVGSEGVTVLPAQKAHNRMNVNHEPIIQVRIADLQMHNKKAIAA